MRALAIVIALVLMVPAAVSAQQPSAKPPSAKPSRGLPPPPGTVFHSQWGETGACAPYPAPGYTYPSSPIGGYWLKRVENLYAKYTRPFWIK